jgi:hypothetical protein
VMENRSPSPPRPRPLRRQSSEDGAVILRRKLEFPPPSPSPAARTPSPQRLMLPPPPPVTAPPGLFGVLRNPTAISATKVVLFCAKAYSLLSPCQPFAAKSHILYPLLCLASLDFLHVNWRGRLMGRNINLGGLGSAVILLLAHMIAVGVLLRWNSLCARRGVEWHGL